MRLVKTFAGWLALILSAVILFVGVFAAVTIWRLSQEPVSLHRLTPYIVDHLNKSMGENKLSVGDLVLRWRGWAEKFDVGLRDVTIIGANDRELLHIPEADVVFSSKALFEGVLALREMNLIGPRIRLERSADGKIDIGYVADEAALDADGLSGILALGEEDDTPSNPDELVYDKGRGSSVTIELPSSTIGETAVVADGSDDISQPAINQSNDSAPLEQNGAVEQSGSDVLRDVIAILSGERTDFPAAAYFESFGVVNADLQVRDEKLGVVWAAPQADILLSRKPLGIGAEASLQVSAGALSTRVSVTGDYSIQTGEIDLEADVGEVELSDLVSISDVFENLRDAYLPVSGKLKAKYDTDGELLFASTDLVVGSGIISLPSEMRATYRVRDGKIVTSYVPGRFNLDDVVLNVGDASAKLQGVVLDPFGKWSVNLDAFATDVQTNDLKHLWPESLGVDARDWVVTNLSEGIVHQASMHTELHQDDEDGIALDALGGQMTMSGVTVHYLGDMPSVLDAGGRAEFDADSFKIYVDRGNADGLTVTDASIEFTRLNDPVPAADIEVVAHGSARKALELIEAEPLGFATRLGIDPAQISGEQATRVRLYFPLLRAVRFEDVEVAAASRIENASITNAFRDLDVTDGTFELQVNTKGLDLNGVAAIGNGKTKINWVENFETNAAIRSHYTLSGDLDLGVLPTVELDASPYLTGMAKGKVDIKVKSDQVELVGDVDLKAVTIALPFDGVDYQKEPGPDAKATFDLAVQYDGGGTLKSFAAIAPELAAEGRGTWRGDNPMADKWVFEIDTATFRDNTDVSGTVRLADDDKLTVDLRGSQFDLRYFVDKDASKQTDPTQSASDQAENLNLMVTLASDRFLLKGDEPLLSDGKITFSQDRANQEIEISARQLIATPWIVSDDTVGNTQPKQKQSPNSGGIGQSATRSGGTTEIFLNIEQMVMANGELLGDVKGSIHTVGQEWDRLVLNGSLGDRANVFAQVTREDFVTRKVKLTSEDAGKFLRAVDMYENLLGGILTVEGTVDDADLAQPFTGTVNIDDFRVVNAPVAARVLGAASLTGLGDVLQGNGISFDELNGGFTYANDVLSLSKISANGTAVGVTANGSIDLAKSEIRLSGSIVPIYALNSALGVIPILGDLLVGEEGGGIFAPTYTVEGDLENPDITVNPLSTFVPGVFRNLITGAEPG
ncbi:AsmA-like C-terminal domain-containing protein [Thalassospira sp.]|uniref:YhdP family protein n=1 Tax=Thalassospira sp. TaxID=1912094 RepID=UPI0032ED94FD